MIRKKRTTDGPVPETSRNWLTVFGARHHNLKGIDVSFPLGALSAVTGVSGSGKSSLVNDILYKSLAHSLHRAQTFPGNHDSLQGVELLNKVIRVDQQPIGQTPTSNAATYTGVFDLIRELFSKLPDSKLRGYSPRRFSFNVPGGRCEKCEGAGQLKIEMHFLPDVWITCDACAGKRYDRQTLEVKFRGFSIADILEMPCGDALELFQRIPGIRRILQTLCDVGLDYISLGQSAPTLSGGEAQRVKLASELARPDTGRTLYLLDEPTTGLHFDDLQNLLDVLHRLVDLGNTVIVIEHNLDVIKNADWIVDLGPEAGAEGGYIVFQGTPEELAEETRNQLKSASKRKTTTNRSGHYLSYTGQALLPVLDKGPYLDRTAFQPERQNKEEEHDLSMGQVGADAKMPWEIDGPRWHTKDRISRRGTPIRWEGRILTEIVQRIEASGHFAPTDWNNRTTVEIRAEKKSLGWFFHAITAEEWLLRLKFRTSRNTFRRDALVSELDLKPLNEMDEIPLYGTEPRVRVQRANGPWQEIELKVHRFDEIDKPAFWSFLETAIREFSKFTKKVEKKPSDLMPWKVLGEKWHFLPKGLIGGDKLLWEHSLLSDIFGILRDVSPPPRIVWTNKMLVPLYRTQRPQKTDDGRTIPWVVVHTKRVDAVYLDLYVKKNSIPLGRIRNIGVAPYVNGENEHYDIVQLRFTSKSELKTPEFRKILGETLSEN